MFLPFFYRLRAHGVKVGPREWLTLLDALKAGLHDESLTGFYQLARAIVVTDETQYDAFDRAFSEAFRGLEMSAYELGADLLSWLSDPRNQGAIDPSILETLRSLSLDELKEQLAERLRTQKERHDGGSRYIGTGGTSPFGQGGMHPSGIRIGGQGGGRSALAVADARRFRDYRKDLVLDVRQLAAALRRLRSLRRAGQGDELDLEATVAKTAKNAGEIEVVLRAPRKNDVRVLLLMDVGGSMDPHAGTVSMLFSAAHQAGTFRELSAFYFHNCVYGELYESARLTKGMPTAKVLQTFGAAWRLIVVGDAAMHPAELAMRSARWWEDASGPTGYEWLQRLAGHYPQRAWLNPEPKSSWSAQTIAAIARVFPMYELSLEGIDRMVEALRVRAGSWTSGDL